MIQPGTNVFESIQVQRKMRSYLLYLPPDYRAGTPYALVLNFHGYGSNGLQQAARSGFTFLARLHGFIVIYPQGALSPDGQSGWSTGLVGRPAVNDVLFVSDLLSQLQAKYCVNPLRIYATGFSNGGGMTNVLACKLSARIAAFAPVSGSYPPVPGGCKPQRPVPIMEFHGTADSVVPYMGNPAKREPAVPLWLQQWATRDDCARGPVTFSHTPEEVGEEWVGCRGNATVTGYSIPGEDHSWPRVLFPLPGASGSSGTASEVIWSFFQEHPLPTSQTTI